MKFITVSFSTSHPVYYLHRERKKDDRIIREAEMSGNEGGAAEERRRRQHDIVLQWVCGLCSDESNKVYKSSV